VDALVKKKKKTCKGSDCMALTFNMRVTNAYNYHGAGGVLFTLRIPKIRHWTPIISIIYVSYSLTPKKSLLRNCNFITIYFYWKLHTEKPFFS